MCVLCTHTFSFTIMDFGNINLFHIHTHHTYNVHNVYLKHGHIKIRMEVVRVLSMMEVFLSRNDYPDKYLYLPVYLFFLEIWLSCVVRYRVPQLYHIRANSPRTSTK